MRTAFFLSVFMVARLCGAGEDVPPAVDPDDVILTENESSVADCTSLGEVSGRSGAGWLITGDRGADRGTEKVVAQIRARAAELGATVVLVQEASSLFVTKAAGTAYRCSAEVLSRMRAAAERRRRRVEQSMIFPERAFVVDSGFIGMQAAVMNRHVQRVPFRGLPTAFFLVVRNETDSPVYVVAKLQLKEKAEEATETIFPSKVKMLTWDSFGVPADEDIPLEVSVYSDKTRKTLRATEKTALFFSSDSLKLLLGNRMDPRSAPTVIIFGWREMFSNVKEVPGSQADPDLQQDIVWTLYREESKSHRDCKRSVLAAERRELDPEALPSRFPKAKPEALLLAGHKGALEVWRVQSCDAVTAYEVLLFTPPDGVTEFLVNRATG